MEKRTRTEITIKTDRVFVISKRKMPSQSWCLDCSQPSRMVPPEEVRNVTGLTPREVYRAVETGEVHFSETHEGLVLICLNSIASFGNKQVSTAMWANPPVLAPLVNLDGEALSRVRIRPNDSSALAGVFSNQNIAESLTEGKKIWLLTPEIFDKLLESLDPHRENAGIKYESIRRRLIKYFECRGCSTPEDLADETINRVARRISEGCEIWTTDPASYFYGVARYVLKEYWGSPDREASPIEYVEIRHPAQAVDAAAVDQSQESLLRALEHCMDTLEAEDRQLLLDYYQGEKSEKIRNRQTLAKQLGIPPNALRIKVHRIRRRLKDDVIEYNKHHS